MVWKQLQQQVLTAEKSRAAIAAESGVSKTLVNHVASGGGVTLEKAERIAKAVGCEIVLKKKGRTKR